MKIAVWHNLPSGGGKRALYYHVRGLAARGHQLACWSLDDADRSYLPLSEFAPEHIVSSEFKLSARKRFSRALTPHYEEAVQRLRAFDDACRRCAREIEAGDFDLLFANSARSFHVPYIMRHVRMKKVLYLQEPSRFMYEANPALPWIASAPENLEEASLLRPKPFMADYANLQTLRLQAKQEWLNAQACDLLLVNSYFSRESVLRAYGVDARVCYLGVDTTLFRNLQLERERFIVGLGSLDQIKRVDLAVRAVALLPEPRPPLVWIANSGNDDYRNSVGELARSLGVELRIHLAIPDEELVTILNRAALLVCTARLEPFGFAALEANACGLPVVGVAEGGLRETIQDGVNGLLVDAGPENIADGVNYLLKNPAAAREMGERAAANVQQNWNVDSSVDRLEKILLQTTVLHG
jgi:glycosyltransferase involved in cell wall biosynthesis